MPLLFLLAILALGGAAVYRWTDADGVVHYSDRPHPGAEKNNIEAAPAAGAARTPPGGVLAGSEAAEVTSARYEELSIQSPAQDEVLWNIEGQLDVTARVEPSLRPGHQLQVLLDGRSVAILPPGSSQTRLSEVFRGTHTLAVEILDEAGKPLMRSVPVKFAVRQTSIANPVNPVTQPVPTPRPRP